MTWLEVSVRVMREHAPRVELVLEQHGAMAVTLQDDEDSPVFEPAPDTTPLWPTVRVRGLFDTECHRQPITQALQRVEGVKRSDRVVWREIRNRDWERVWMDRFRPMRFGKHLWIVPTGMSIPHRRKNVEIQLDPGLAFGTGAHPTTALCLEWLDGCDLSGTRVVDFGCGSGVLAIAAALKGAEKVFCVDIDAQALEATRYNSVRNDVADRIVCSYPVDFQQDNMDVVLANILAGPLIELSAVLLDALRRGGRIVLSGILEEQVSSVASAYQGACRDLRSEIRQGWARLDAVKS